MEVMASRSTEPSPAVAVCDGRGDDGASATVGGTSHGGREGAEEPQQPPPAVCRHWARKGLCVYGDRCRFLHPANQQGPLPGPELPPGAKGNDATRVLNRGPGKRNVVRNRFRASAFRRFLLEKFGQEQLASGSGVLDVAGGKGELSFELVNLNQIRSTVIDPRPLQLTKFEKYMKKGIYHRNEVFRKYIVPTVEEVQSRTELPQHLRMCLEPRMVCLAGQHPDVSAEDEGSSLQQLRAMAGDSLEAAKGMRWTRKGLEIEGHDEDEGVFASMDDTAPSDSDDSIVSDIFAEAQRWEQCSVSDPQTAVETLLSCSAVVGMHPDQATEPIVDLALSLGRPFAVVPCCVYGRFFPGRRMPSGEPVGSYEEFIDYLMLKSPHIKCEQLPFEGRNLVLYSSGHCQASEPPDERR